MADKKEKKSISLNDLTPEQRAELLKEAQELQKENQEKIREDRQAYKDMVDQMIDSTYPKLKEASSTLGEVKNLVIENFKTLIKMKADLYGKEEEQTSHSFSSKDGSKTIIIGYNMIDGWDDTVNTGIAKVKEYYAAIGDTDDKQKKQLAESIMKLLSRDYKGNLKASRILQLKQMADESGDKDFIDGVNIIQDAYRPVRSKSYVRCFYKDDNGVSTILPLSITDAEEKKEEAEDAK